MAMYRFEDESGRSLPVFGGIILDGDPHLQRIDEPEELVDAVGQQMTAETNEQLDYAQHTRRMGDLAVAEYLRNQSE